MKRIKIPLLVLLFGLLSNSHVYATKSCDCESHAIELTNKTNYNEVLKALITDHQETYKMQLALVDFLLRVEKCPEKLRLSAKTAQAKLRAGQTYLTTFASKTSKMKLNKDTFISKATELRNYTNQTRSAIHPVLYGKNKPSAPTDPIIVNPGFTWVDCNGGSDSGSSSGGNSTSECESKGDDIAAACATASSIKSECAYYNQFGSQEAAQEQANAEMQNCIDKSTTFKIICNISRLACAGGDFSSFGSAADREVIEDAVEDCRRAATDAASNSQPQTQTANGN